MQAYHTSTLGSLRLWDAGVTWSDIETSPGVYDWSRLDSYVHAAQQHDTQVTLVLAMTPSFYGPAPTLPPTVLSDYADYVRAVMTRYRNFHGPRGIAAYQVWNEGNVPTFWTGTPYQLALMTRDGLADPPAGRPRRHHRGPVVRRAARVAATVAVGVPVPAGRQRIRSGTTTTPTP